jgi:excisionase family DNA binding protein
MYTFEPHQSYSIPEAARILGVSRGALNKRVRRGTLRAERVGHSYVVQGAELIAALKAKAKPPEPQKSSRDQLIETLCPKIPAKRRKEAGERLDEYLRFTLDLAERIAKERNAEGDSPQESGES